MSTVLQRLLAGVAAALLAGTGLTLAAAGSPMAVGLVSAASADEDDDDGPGDDDDGSDDDDDGGPGDDDDGGQAPAGGVDTGFGGAADLTSEPVSSDRSSGDLAGTVVPVAAVGLGGLALARLAFQRASRTLP